MRARVSVVEKNAVSEAGALAVDRLHIDLPTKCLHDVLADEEPKADAMRVHLACILEIAKHLEKTKLVLLPDANTIVTNRDHKLVLQVFRLVHPLDLLDHLLLVVVEPFTAEELCVCRSCW